MENRVTSFHTWYLNWSWYFTGRLTFSSEGSCCFLFIFLVGYSTESLFIIFLELQLLEWVFQQCYLWTYEWRNAASIRISSRVSSHFFCFLNLKKVLRLCGVAIRDLGNSKKSLFVFLLLDYSPDHSPLFSRLVRFDGTPAILFFKGEGSPERVCKLLRGAGECYV